MTTDQINYALAKQISCIHTAQSNYGDIDLAFFSDDDRERVAAALRAGLENELRRREALPHESA